MPIIRRKLDPAVIYPTTQRYNEDSDTVQSFVNGEWVDNPASDPRLQTLFPPRTTGDTKCDAAESVKDAFKNTIDNTITLISESKTFFSIAGAILALFEFGPFGLFIVLAIALANAMLDAGTISLEAALTDPVYHTFACILYCHMDGDGRITGHMAEIQTDIDNQIGGLAAVVLKAMLFIAGEGGVNNLASLGTSTGDCSDCECCECDLTAWTEVVGNTITYFGDCIAEIVASTGHGDALYYAGLFAPSDSDDCHMFGVTVVSGSIFTGGNVRSWAVCGESGVATHVSGLIPPGDTCYRTLYYVSNVPFTVRFTCIGDCTA
jgi:hypothetical protein